MGDSLRGHRSTWSSISGQADVRRPAMDSFGSLDSSNNRPATNRTGSLDLMTEKSFLAPALKSRRTLRESKSMVTERKAYPLPDPSQVENPSNAAPLSSDSVNDILYPLQSLKKEREKSQAVEVCRPSAQPPLEALKEPAGPVSSMGDADKQPFPGDSKVDVKRESKAVSDSTEITPLETLKEEEHVNMKKEEAAAVQPGDAAIVNASKKVVVVSDGEKKFSTAPVDIALEGYATAEGNAIVVVAFLEHVMSPMGMKMVADLKQFSGVNESILKQAILVKKSEIDTKLRDSNRLRVCQIKKVQLDVKVLPGSNPKALVAKEIIDSQATCVIFDKGTMKNRKYYEENLSCHILRLRNDGRRVETISLFGQGVEKTGSITSHCSDSSSDSSVNSELGNSPSIWSKLKLFGSKRSTGSLRHSHGGQGSVIGSSSRTSSNLGSPRPLVQEDDGPVPEVLEESFSFDSPKPNPAEAYAYAAAGLDKLGTYTRSNGESLKQPAALAA